MPDPAIALADLHKRYGRREVLCGLDLVVPAGTTYGLVGPNGAGKTTLFHLITAFDQADAGDWFLDGRSLRGARPYAIARAGMVRTFQLTKSLAKMTVLENMLLAARGQRGERLGSALVPRRWRGQERANLERAESLLERFNLAHMRDEYAITLSGGQRKLLEMARALMTEPSVILLDEPMAGVNPALVQSLLVHIEALRDEGVSVVFIEHDMDVIMGISDWIAVLAEGRVIAEGTPAQVSTDTAVIDAYLGTSFAADELGEEE